MEHRQRLFCSSSSYLGRQDLRTYAGYVPPSPTPPVPPLTATISTSTTSHPWIRASSSSVNKLSPNRQNNYLQSFPTPPSPLVPNRQRYTPRFAASIQPFKTHSPNYYPLMQANLQKDTTLTKIFVGGLPYHTTDETLRAFFSKFGEIEEAVVINDRSTGKSRGYGFVTMARKEDAEKAVLEPNPTIDGRRANVNLAYMGAKNRTATLPVSYSLLTRMPTYQSSPAAYTSNLIYYPLAQQSTLQQPIYFAPATGATGTTWPTNLLSQLNLAPLANATNGNVANGLNPTTTSPPTIFEIPNALLEPNGLATATSTLSNNVQTSGQQLYWSNYN